MTWQIHEAQQRLSHVVQRALDEGPQIVTRRGEPVAVIISMDTYRRLNGGGLDFKEFLLSGPDLSLLDLGRPRDLPRDIDLSLSRGW
jgi:prevent-host-death family protein